MISLMCMVPFKMPGGKPPIEVPGLKQILPVILVGPVLVMVDPAKTAKSAVPATFTVACTVVCSGISCRLFVGGVGSSFLQAANVIRAARKSVVVIILIRWFGF